VITLSEQTINTVGKGGKAKKKKVGMDTQKAKRATSKGPARSRRPNRPRGRIWRKGGEQSQNHLLKTGKKVQRSAGLADAWRRQRLSIGRPNPDEGIVEREVKPKRLGLSKPTGSNHSNGVRKRREREFEEKKRGRGYTEESCQKEKKKPMGTCKPWGGKRSGAKERPRHPSCSEPGGEKPPQKTRVKGPRTFKGKRGRKEAKSIRWR